MTSAPAPQQLTLDSDVQLGLMTVWYGMVEVCDGYLAAEASGSSFG